MVYHLCGTQDRQVCSIPHLGFCNISPFVCHIFVVFAGHGCITCRVGVPRLISQYSPHSPAFHFHFL